MNQRLLLGGILTVILAVGYIGYNFWDNRRAQYYDLGTNEIEAFAAKLGRTNSPAQAPPKPLDMSHPVRLAIGGLGFADDQQNQQLQQLGDLVTVTMTGQPGFDLVERQSLAKILHELNLSWSGFVRAKDAVIDIAGGAAGDVWFVAENAPTRLHRYQAKKNSWEATLRNCSCLASDNSRLFVGQYGVATSSLGVSVLDLKSNRWHELTAIDGLTPNAVSALAIDGRNLWVGGLGYIALVDLEQDKTLKFAHIQSSAVDHIQIAGGYVWAQFDRHLYRVPLSAVK